MQNEKDGGNIIYKFILLQTIESFHCAIGPVLSIARVFGLFPVAGVRSVSPSKLQFKTLSFVAFYSGVIASMIFFMTIVSVLHMVKTLNANTIQTRGKWTLFVTLHLYFRPLLINMCNRSNSFWKNNLQDYCVQLFICYSYIIIYYFVYNLFLEAELASVR